MNLKKMKMKIFYTLLTFMRKPRKLQALSLDDLMREDL